MTRNVVPEEWKENLMRQAVVLKISEELQPFIGG